MSPDREQNSGVGFAGWSPVVAGALAGMAGVVGGELLRAAWVWLGAAGVGVAAMLWMARLGRWRGVRCWAVVAFFALAGAWQVVRTHRVGADSIQHFVLAERSQLAEITGRVTMSPKLTETDRGGFGRYGFHSPGTVAMIDVASIVIGGEDVSASGRLLLKIDEADHRLQFGDRIRAVGWLGPIAPPMNPGEYDFRELAARQGIVGRFTLAVRDNWSLVDSGRAVDVVGRMRSRFASRAIGSLHVGLPRDPTNEADRERLAFLEAILLGNRTSQVESLADSFRVVGLSHLLAISGAHLAILLGMIWFAARVFRFSPSRAAMIVVVVLLLYMFAVPLRTPIVRAGIMAALLAGGQLVGRRIATMDLLCIAALVVLAWRPSDLFSPGFQLSFGAVAGLLLFTTPLAKRLLAFVGIHDDLLPGLSKPKPWYAPSRLARVAAQYVSVNIVAFLIVFPLVAFHFKIITPTSIVFSILALPLVVALLAIGYLKIAVGLILPSAGMLLGEPLALVSDFFTNLVERGAAVPGVSLTFARSPSIAWTIVMTAVAVLFLSGWFAKRRLALLAIVAICGVWMAIEVDTNLSDRLFRSPGPPTVLRLNTLAVGNGSCHVLRTGRGDDELAIMFDCGSQGHFNIGNTSIVPALQAIGVRRIDILILSHADVDHFNGLLDVADHVPIDRVLVSPQLIARAKRDRDDLAAGERDDESITSFLVHSLDDQDFNVEIISRGWKMQHGDASFEMIWPPADFDPDVQNDASLVLSTTIAGRRLLLNGDIHEQAMEAMFEMNMELKADVGDLPHHGSFCDASEAWIKRVGPAYVVQSSGPSRLYQDQWAELIEAQKIKRYVTALSGMIELRIDATGAITVEPFRDADGDRD